MPPNPLMTWQNILLWGRGLLANCWREASERSRRSKISGCTLEKWLETKVLDR
jgi:hypothetical protein